MSLLDKFNKKKKEEEPTDEWDTSECFGEYSQYMQCIDCPEKNECRKKSMAKRKKLTKEEKTPIDITKIPKSPISPPKTKKSRSKPKPEQTTIEVNLNGVKKRTIEILQAKKSNKSGKARTDWYIKGIALDVVETVLKAFDPNLKIIVETDKKT